MRFPQKQLEQVLKIVQNAPCSYYRDLWKQKGTSQITFPVTKNVWETIPFLERADITLAAHPSKRLYTDLTYVECLRSTSGTSSREPLYVWRGPSLPNVYSELYTWAKDRGARRVLKMYSLPNYARVAIPAFKNGLDVLWGDTHNLKQTAKIIARAQVDTIEVSPTLCTILGDYLEQEQYTEHIKLIVLWAEYCTDTVYTTLQHQFPNARFLFEYGSSEAGSFVMASTEQCESPNKKMHVFPDFYPEVIEGELVITSLYLPQPFPLIRYRTGDAASIIEHSCICGRTTPRITLEGRMGGDFVNAGGGRVTGEEIDRILTPFYPHIDKVFKVEVAETKQGRNVVASLSVSVSKKKESNISEELLRSQIASAFEDMRLTPTMRLKQAIASKLFDSPIVKLVPFVQTNNKNPRLVIRKEFN